MLLKSEVTGKEYEVKTFTMEDGSRGICHESLQAILENYLCPGVSYDTEVLAATETYCAAKCTITDEAGRKIQAFNDVNINALKGKEPQQEEFTRAHPLISSVQTAIDIAVRTYLGWPRIIKTEEFSGTSVIDAEPNIPKVDHPEDGPTLDSEDSPALDEDAREAELNAALEAANAEYSVDGSDFDGMNAPEPENEAADDENIDARLAELGSMKPPKGKYVDLTYNEIWENHQSWFGYVVKNNKSDTYATAREFIRLKEKKEQQ